MKKVIKIIFRILASPFVFGLILMGSLKIFFFHSYLYLRYGGNWVGYHKNLDPFVVSDLINEVKSLKKYRDEN